MWLLKLCVVADTRLILQEATQRQAAQSAVPVAQGAWPSSFACYQDSLLGEPWHMGSTPEDAGEPMEVPDSAALGCRAGSVPSPWEGRVPSMVMAALVHDPGPGFGAGSGRGLEPPARTCRVYAVPRLGEESYASPGEPAARSVRRQPSQQEVKAEVPGPDQAPEPCPGQPRRRRAAVRALALIKGELSGSGSGGDESDAEADDAGDADSGRCGREARRMRRARLAEGCAGGSGDEAPGGWSAREREPPNGGALQAYGIQLLSWAF